MRLDSLYTEAEKETAYNAWHDLQYQGFTIETEEQLRDFVNNHLPRLTLSEYKDLVRAFRQEVSIIIQ